MKYEIMLGILFELLSKKSVSATYLAEKYQVSPRSIYRYISCIEGAGVPIYTSRGNQGGFSIVDTFRFPSTFLTKQELEQTVSTLSAIVESVPNKVLSEVINKLKSNVKNCVDDILLKSGNLVIDAGPWGDTVGYKNKLSVVQKCIDECSILKIKYHDRNGTVTERDIFPHIIVFKQGLWYVYAYCTLRNTFRFFKIGRIEHAFITQEKFTRKPISPKDLPLNFWENNALSDKVVLEVEKKYLSDIEEWLGIENVKQTEGKYFAEANLPYDGGLISKIMSYGDGIKVLSPQKLIDEIKTKTLEIIKKYN